jgi:hypothetical protein
MKRLGILLSLSVLLVLVSACTPKHVLSREKMTEVLFDLHLTEAALSNTTEALPATWTQGLTPSQFRDLAYRSVLRKHGLTPEAFWTSVAWYSKHVDRYNRIYDDLQKRLEAYQTEIASGKFRRSVRFGVSIDPQKLALYESLLPAAVRPITPPYTSLASNEWLKPYPKSAIADGIMLNASEESAVVSSVIAPTAQAPRTADTPVTVERRADTRSEELKALRREEIQRRMRQSMQQALSTH